MMTPAEFADSLGQMLQPLKEFLLEAKDARALSSSIVALHDPARAPQYYAFEVWPGLSMGKIKQYEQVNSLLIPDSYRELLKQINGICLKSLTLYGIPPSMLKNPPGLDRSARQPLDLASANKHWRHKFTSHAMSFHIGSFELSSNENVGIFFEGPESILAVRCTGDIVQRWTTFAQVIEFGIDPSIGTRLN